MRLDRLFGVLRFARGVAVAGVVLNSFPAFAVDFPNLSATSTRLADFPTVTGTSGSSGDCKLRSLRGSYPQQGSIELFATMHCMKKWALHDQYRATDEAIKSDGVKWGVHLGRDKLFFTLGTNW